MQAGGVWACARACARARMRVGVRACVCTRACVRACAHVQRAARSAEWRLFPVEHIGQPTPPTKTKSRQTAATSCSASPVPDKRLLNLGVGVFLLALMQRRT
jgi:hypothetical protein